MKRDMDLVRHILIKTEEAPEPIEAQSLVRGKWDEELVSYHIDMMQSHGLVDASVSRDYDGSYVDCVVDGLTWDGCDYLDAIRDDSIWSKTKRVVKESVGSTTLEVIKQAAIMVATSAIKAHLGIT